MWWWAEVSAVDQRHQPRLRAAAWTAASSPDAPLPSIPESYATRSGYTAQRCAHCRLMRGSRPSRRSLVKGHRSGTSARYAPPLQLKRHAQIFGDLAHPRVGTSAQPRTSHGIADHEWRYWPLHENAMPELAHIGMCGRGGPDLEAERGAVRGTNRSPGGPLKPPSRFPQPPTYA